MSIFDELSDDQDGAQLPNDRWTHILVTARGTDPAIYALLSSSVSRATGADAISLSFESKVLLDRASRKRDEIKEIICRAEGRDMSIEFLHEKPDISTNRIEEIERNIEFLIRVYKEMRTDLDTIQLVSRKVDYHEYIKSPEWRERATQAKERAGWRCQTCNVPGDYSILDAHHRTYERLGHEDPDDITVLCRPCHEAITAAIKGRK